MKEYIHKKLEEKTWLTPTDIDKMIRPSQTQQITETLKNWRQENNITQESYVGNNLLNENNLIFF